VTGYLDTASENLLEIAERIGQRKAEGGEIAAAVRDAFGFVPGGVEATKRRLEESQLYKRTRTGRFHALREHDEHELLMFADVYIDQLAGVDRPFDRVASEFGRDSKTVRRVWKKYNTGPVKFLPSLRDKK
jgi:hypothetical protein